MMNLIIITGSKVSQGVMNDWVTPEKDQHVANLKFYSRTSIIPIGVHSNLLISRSVYTGWWWIYLHGKPCSRIKMWPFHHPGPRGPTPMRSQPPFFSSKPLICGFVKKRRKPLRPYYSQAQMYVSLLRFLKLVLDRRFDLFKGWHQTEWNIFFPCIHF